jgi:hypothetical protein
MLGLACVMLCCITDTECGRRVRLVATSARLLLLYGALGALCDRRRRRYMLDIVTNRMRLLGRRPVRPRATDDTHMGDSMEGRDWPTLTGGKRVLELGVWLRHAGPERGSCG